MLVLFRHCMCPTHCGRRAYRRACSELADYPWQGLQHNSYILLTCALVDCDHETDKFAWADIQTFCMSMRKITYL